MAKKSQKRPSRRGRDQAGCIWGLISMFDFRHGRSTKRLLSDRSRMSMQSFGAGNSSIQTIIQGPIEKCEELVDSEESRRLIADAVKTSVKELMEEEMFKEKGSKNRSNDSEINLDQIESKYGQHVKKNQKRSKSSDTDVSELDAAKISIPENLYKALEQKASENLDLEKIMEELIQINHDFHSDRKISSGRVVTIVEEKLVAALNLFIEQRISKNNDLGEDGKSHCSKEFVNALQILKSNKGLFSKLLQDQDSMLVKHIQNLEKDQKSSSSPEKSKNSKYDEIIINRKNRNFFRKRNASLENSPSVGSRNHQSSSKIVILKPGPTGAVRSTEPDPEDNKLHNEKNTSQFSFTEIKRKLRHAMGKEKQGVSSTGENFGWSSPNRNHFYTERFAKSLKKGESKAKGSAIVDEPYQYPRLGVSNMYVEAKKHLSEMLNNGEENGELMMTGQLNKSLGRILSLPEYKCSPCNSPRKNGDEIFITAQMRLSPRGVVKNNVSGILQENRSDNRSPSKKNSENVQECLLETRSFTEETQIIEVPIEEATELGPREEENIENISSESSSNSISDDIQNGEIRERDDEESASQCLNDSSQIFELDLSEQDRILSSPTGSPNRSTVSMEVKDSDYPIEKTGRPSPISVLEPLFTDDDISPASTVPQPVEKEIEPRHIHFEEQSSSTDPGICIRISNEDEESPFEYVEAVLLGSGLNWDEFLLRWISLYEILESSLFDEVELFSSRPRHDQKLLFDGANEALKEICETYFGCFTGINHIKRNIRPVPKGMDFINEIWGKVEWHLVQNLPPHSLERLIKRDMEKSRKWVNLQSDIELIGFEIGEMILDELVEDMVRGVCSEIEETGL